MTIRPSSELRNSYNSIARLCKESGEPVYLTVNGKGDTALISIEVLEALYAKLDLYKDIVLGLKDVCEGKFLSENDLRKELRVNAVK